MILSNGRIYTLDGQDRVVDTLFVRAGRIAFAGRRRELNAPVGERFEATATVLAGADRDRVFAAIVGDSPAAGEYQAMTRRTIPVVALERRRG